MACDLVSLWMEQQNTGETNRHDIGYSRSAEDSQVSIDAHIRFAILNRALDELQFIVTNINAAKQIFYASQERNIQ
jgi:hypothetical protein